MQQSQDLEYLTECLKQKMLISSRQKQVQLLTLTPPSWTISQTQQYFGVSAYLVKKARELKASDGILADPMLKKGKALAPSTVDAVLAFFEDDEISRPCPGKKDFVSVKVHGKREQKQKRLILLNLNEMYAQFKERHPQLKIGISKFCELRPKWCVTVGARGMHSVCVCTIHQNPKLMLAAIGGLKMDLHQVMELQARSQGGSGGSYDTPQLPIPKILFHPLAILFHPLAILFHLSAILFHPLAILFHLSAILFHPLAILFHPSAILFHPLAILFHPWNMWMTSHGQCPRGGCL